MYRVIAVPLLTRQVYTPNKHGVIPPVAKGHPFPFLFIIPFFFSHLSFPWGFPTQPKTPIAIISGTGKTTNFKFGQNNNGVHPNKSPLKIL